ncbi:hypothetical protein ACGFZA_15935 [Streptomyces sp. NPDC048211]|uniref:hypothetical protein n=1 Tax=Streptomyces sp. NPDC048211 TaxID=3365516 RepID=UPI0037190671
MITNSDLDAHWFTRHTWEERDAILWLEEDACDHLNGHPDIDMADRYRWAHLLREERAANPEAWQNRPRTPYTQELFMVKNDDCAYEQSDECGCSLSTMDRLPCNVLSPGPPTDAELDAWVNGRINEYNMRIHALTKEGQDLGVPATEPDPSIRGMWRGIRPGYAILDEIGAFDTEQLERAAEGLRRFARGLGAHDRALTFSRTIADPGRDRPADHRQGSEGPEHPGPGRT